MSSSFFDLFLLDGSIARVKTVLGQIGQIVYTVRHIADGQF